MRTEQNVDIDGLSDELKAQISKVEGLTININRDGTTEQLEAVGVTSGLEIIAELKISSI